jgi:hypothetical protein
MKQAPTITVPAKGDLPPDDNLKEKLQRKDTRSSRPNSSLS